LLPINIYTIKIMLVYPIKDNNIKGNDKMVKKNTSENKKPGRAKKTDVEYDEAYQVYMSRIEVRNSVLGDDETPIKLLDRESWNKSKPSGETSNEIFVRLVKARMPKMLRVFKNIKALGKYTHTKENTDKIINDLNKAVESVKTAFEAKSENKEDDEEYQL